MGYKLYVGAISEYNPKNEYAFYNSDGGYVLVYSEKKPSGKFYRVTSKIAEELTPMEQEWLINVCNQVNLTVDIMNKFIDEFEKNLKEIKEEYIGGNEK